MKHITRKLCLAFLFCFTLSANAQQVDPTVVSQFEEIKDAIEVQFAELFPLGTSAFVEGEFFGDYWIGYFWALTGVYAALNTDEMSVYTLGGALGDLTNQGSFEAIRTALGLGMQTGGGGENRILTQGSGSCVDLTDPPDGTVAEYAGVTSSEEGSLDIAYTTTYVSSTENTTTTQTEQSVFSSGFTTNSSSTSTVTFERMNGWLFTKQVDAEATTDFMGFSTTISTMTVFEPSEFASPETICSGMSFFSAKVNSTTTSTSAGFPLPPVSGPTSDSITEILSVSESLTVPAGTFNTVHQKIQSLDDNGEPTEGRTEAWFINDVGGVPARLDLYDDSDTLISSVELQDLLLP